MRRAVIWLGALAALAQVACSRSASDSLVVVTVTAPDGMPAVQLRVFVTNTGTPDTRFFPPAPAATPIAFPAVLGLALPRSRSGDLSIAIDALDAAANVVASGSGDVAIAVGGQSNVTVALAPPTPAGDAGVTGSDADSGATVPSDGSVPDGPLAGDARPPDTLLGHGGAGGATGTGGSSGAGGSAPDAPGAGGSTGGSRGGGGAGGTTGTGGSSGTGGAPDAPGAGGSTGAGGGGSGGAVSADVPPPAGCGNGIVVFPEQCDDGNNNAGDGCSPFCKVEIGWKCTGSLSACTPTTCGDGVVEGAELCDDGNTMPFDGCSSDCQVEPTCAGSGPCTSRCGDGIVLGEDCDDGNTVDGDGCSSSCKVEPGFACAQPPLGEKMLVPAIYRDFRYHNPAEFEAGISGVSAASPGMVESDLDPDGKPVYSGLAGTGIHVTSAATFAEWYRNTDGVNHATSSKLALWDNGSGAYVNRYGPNGEKWNLTTTAMWCGSASQAMLDASGNPIPCTYLYQQSESNPSGGLTDCQKEAALGYPLLQCTTDSTGAYRGIYLVQAVDGNPLFFPVDGDAFTPSSELGPAQVPSTPAGLYDSSGTWPYDLDTNGNRILHNFSFTSEVRYWFKYQADASLRLDLIGDDDVWLFVNKKLAIDLGGVHLPVSGAITFDPGTAAGLGLVDGNVYEVAVFQAERQTTSSTFRLTLAGFNTARSECSSR